MAQTCTLPPVFLPPPRNTKVDAGWEACKLLDQRFETLQTIQKRMQEIRDAGSSVPFPLYQEWDLAYELFQRAHQDWKSVIQRGE